MHRARARRPSTRHPVAAAGARACAAGIAVLLGLAACEPQRTTAPPAAAPAIEPAKGATQDPSVPAAASVVRPPTTPTAQDTGQGRAEGRLTREQEASAMPLPGQVNDHSTSRAPPPRGGASAP